MNNMNNLHVSTSNIPLPKPGCPLGEDMVLIKKNIYGVIDGVAGSSIREGDPSTWYQCRDYIETFIQVLNTVDHLDIAVNKAIESMEYYDLYGTFTCAFIKVNENDVEYLVVGDAKLKHDLIESMPMMQYGRCPCQIGKLRHTTKYLTNIKHLYGTLPKGGTFLLHTDGIDTNYENVVYDVKQLCANSKIIDDKTAMLISFQQQNIDH